MVTNATDIAVNSIFDGCNQKVDVSSLVSHNMGQQAPTEAIPFAQQHAEQRQAQAQTLTQTKPQMKDMKQDSLMRPRVKHRSHFALLANVAGIITDAAKRMATETIDSDAPPGRGEEGLPLDRRN